jgi:hypothetical protein
MRIRLTVQVACMGEKRNEYKTLTGKCGGNERRGRSGVDENIIFKWILKGIGGHELDSSGLGQGRVVGC